MGDDSNQITLRSNGKEVSDRLTTELQERLQIAGVEVVETRITHLSYATEIASAMLQKQQSAAILAARKMIVDGAVSITEDAINRLGSGHFVQIFFVFRPCLCVTLCYNNSVINFDFESRWKWL